MSPYFKRIALLGHGRIGQTIKAYLEDVGFEVDAYDIKPQKDVQRLNPNQTTSEYFKEIIEPYDGVVTATPYHLNMAIASAAIQSGKAYFDLTEDVQVAHNIRALAELESHGPEPKLVWVMPQCGLAPGAVNTIARDIAQRFDKVTDINIRVGALPTTANNKMKYYLTWSSEGLINEYCNPCEALINGKKVTLQPLEGCEEIVIDGVEYEAFNTSGGIGTLIDTLLETDSPVLNVNYKTIRYKGHRDLMHFLLDDLGLATKQKTLVDIFNREVPHVTTDVVVIFIQVLGYHDGDFQAQTYCRKIYGDDRFTAIQRTTAAGVCAAVYYWATRPWGNGYDLNGTFIMSPEHIRAQDLKGNPFWKIYDV